MQVHACMRYTTCVWVHCYAFLHVSLLVLAVICVRKIWMVPSCVLRLAIFCTAKEEREKGKRWGPHVAVRVRASALGEGARRECAVALMVVGSAHAPLPGIGQSERAREISSGHVLLMSCCARYI